MEQRVAADECIATTDALAAERGVGRSPQAASEVVEVAGFKLRGEITDIEVIAVGRAIRNLRLLNRLHGRGRWRKLKGLALVELPSGRVLRAELHWYEAHGLGRHDMKIKRLLH